MWRYITAETPCSAAIYHFLLVLLTAEFINLLQIDAMFNFLFQFIFGWAKQYWGLWASSWALPRCYMLLGRCGEMPALTHHPQQARRQNALAGDGHGEEVVSWPGNPAMTMLWNIQGKKGEGSENIQIQQRALGILLRCRCWFWLSRWC